MNFIVWGIFFTECLKSLLHHLIDLNIDFHILNSWMIPFLIVTLLYVGGILIHELHDTVTGKK